MEIGKERLRCWESSKARRLPTETGPGSQGTESIGEERDPVERELVLKEAARTLDPNFSSTE